MVQTQDSQNGRDPDPRRGGAEHPHDAYQRRNLDLDHVRRPSLAARRGDTSRQRPVSKTLPTGIAAVDRATQALNAAADQKVPTETINRPVTSQSDPGGSPEAAVERDPRAA